MKRRCGLLVFARGALWSALLFALVVVCWALRRFSCQPRSRGSHRAYAAMLGVAGTTTSVVIAVLTPQYADIPLIVLIFALAWFVAPLAVARWSGNKKHVDDLVRGRSDSLTLLILKFVARVLVVIAALFASLWGFPVAILVAIAVNPTAGIFVFVFGVAAALLLRFIRCWILPRHGRT